MTFQQNPVTAKLFAKLLRFVLCLQALATKLTPPPFRLIQIGSAFWQSRVLYTATQLNIATLIGDGQLSSDAIAQQLGADADAIYRLLRLLRAMGVFEEVSAHVFKNNALSNYLRDDQPQNVRAMILMHNSMVMSKPWYEQLEHGIRSGHAPFELAHQQGFYNYLDHHAEFDALFSSAMNSMDALTGDSFVLDFDWGKFDRIIDIGGSKGTKSLAILQHHKQLEAMIVDREQVIHIAGRYWRENQSPSMLGRVAFQAGNLLESIPKAKDNKDIYFLSAVLHCFDDPHCVQILRNLVTAIADTGARIALMELIMPETKADIAIATIDMQMFMATQGRERTLNEWQRLFEQAGLVLEEQVHLKSMAKLLVLRKS